jgi:hypothetical protein
MDFHSDIKISRNSLIIDRKFQIKRYFISASRTETNAGEYD